MLNRIEIEAKLHRDRAWLLETYAMLSPEDLKRGVTRSEHEAAKGRASMWTPKDHLAHLAGIEFNFVRMIRRHLAGEANPVGLREGPDGAPRTMEQIMASVHEMTEAWTEEHRSQGLSEVVALGQKARAGRWRCCRSCRTSSWRRGCRARRGRTGRSGACWRRTRITGGCTGGG